jgi:hypothetical protein
MDGFGAGVPKREVDGDAGPEARARAATRAGGATGTRRASRRFLDPWYHVDPDRPELAEARRTLTQ